MSIPRLFPLAVLLFTTPVAAQEVGGAWTFGPDAEEPPSSSGFGSSITGTFDYDLDGVGDLVIGTWVTNGRFFVSSGADGTILEEVFLPRSGMGWDSAGIPDINQDGTNDFIVTSGFASAAGADVYFYSGRDLTILHTIVGADYGGSLGFGWRVGIAGDTDGDGVDDYYISDADFTDPVDGSEGAVFLFSGTDLSLLLRIDNPGGGGLGRFVAPLGDVNDDGCADLAAS